MKFLKRVVAVVLTAGILAGAAGCSKSHKAFSYSDVEDIPYSRLAEKYEDVTVFSSDIMNPTMLEGKPAYIKCKDLDAQSVYNVIVNRFHTLPVSEVKDAFYMCCWQEDKAGTPTDTTIYILTFKDSSTAERIFGALEVSLILGWPNGKNASGKKGYQYSTVYFESETGTYERGLYRSKNTVLFVKGVCNDGRDDDLVAEFCNKLDVVTPVKAK